MRTYLKLWFAGTCMLGIGLANAQTTKPSATDPTPMGQIIRALNGQWDLKVEFEPASGLPAGTTGTGHETWRAAVTGKALLSEESWKAGPVDMALLGVLWWDSKDNRLHAMDCNNLGKSVCDPKDAVDAVVVRWSGTELVIEEPERDPDGKLVTSRVTFKDIKADSFTEMASLETAPGKFETMTVIKAVRGK